MGCDHGGYEAREESRQSDGYGKLPQVGFADSLEPHRSPICFKPEQRKRWTSVKLPEFSAQTKSVRINLTLYPGEQLFDPPGSTKRPDGLSALKFAYLTQHIGCCDKILPIVEGLIRE